MTFNFKKHCDCVDGSRRRYQFDPSNNEHQEAQREALIFRQKLYQYAQTIFAKSPNLLKQLTPKAVGDRGDGLALFNTESPPRLKCAKAVIITYLRQRADIHIDKDEKKKLNLLLDFIDNFDLQNENV